MNPAEFYKRRAAECVRLSASVGNAADKALLLQMAKSWLQLAERLEERQDLAGKKELN